MAIDTTQFGGTCNVGDYIRNVAYTWVNGQLGLNDTAWLIVTANNAFSYGDLAWAIQTRISALLAPLLANPTQILGSRASNLIPALQLQAGVATDTAVGTAGATLCPTQTCGIVTWQNGFSGQASRGRIFLPFPSTVSQSVATGLPTPLYLTNLQALATAYVTSGLLTSQDGLRTALVSQQIFNRAALNGTQIIGAVSRPYWATQKRRGDLGRYNPPYIPF